MQIRGVVDNKYTKERKLISRENFNPEDESFYITDEMDLKLELSEILKNQDIREAFSLCLKEIEEDTELGVVFLSWSKGNESKVIAEDLGLTVKEVEAIKQKIRRKLKKLNLSLD
jgi:DNA-binding NarL/FixJ family response regulator